MSIVKWFKQTEVEYKKISGENLRDLANKSDTMFFVCVFLQIRNPKQAAEYIQEIFNEE